MCGDVEIHVFISDCFLSIENIEAAGRQMFSMAITEHFPQRGCCSGLIEASVAALGAPEECSGSSSGRLCFTHSAIELGRHKAGLPDPLFS
jgi:hypothetical protein